MSSASPIDLDAIFIGANKQTQASDYDASQELYAYGADSCVALWRPTDKSNRGVHATLTGHRGEVTAVTFIANSNLLVSGSQDKSIRVWRKNSNDEYVVDHILDHHTGSVTCLAAVDERFLLTGSTDGTVALCEFDSSTLKFRVVHRTTILLRFLPLSLTIQNIDDHNNYVVAVTGTSSDIYLHAISGADPSLNLVAIVAGHEDWVKCASFVPIVHGRNYILASGSQDRYVRLWRLQVNEEITEHDADTPKLSLAVNKQYQFDIAEGSRAVLTFEALLVGHDDWITGLQWDPSCSTRDKLNRKLLSASADTALMIWEMDEPSGVWVCTTQLGDFSSKGASTATGALGGFWACTWLQHEYEQYILAVGATGLVRSYRRPKGEPFVPVPACTGPICAATSVAWNESGEYLFATSLDKTTRLFAQWRVGHNPPTWHEFSRPQIHGYDMICVALLDSTRIVSGGDEKVLRVYEMTESIGHLLNRTCDITVARKDGDGRMPAMALLPALGLSSKAQNDDEGIDGIAEDPLATLNSPPVEDVLQRHTLFPETEKVYGHGYETVCCAVSPNGRFVATACRSNTARHAVIRVYDACDEWQAIAVLEGHSLTVTALKFSPDDDHLLAVSRDRLFSVWNINGTQFSLVDRNTKAHSRIVWDCTWLEVTLNNSLYFVTCSRDRLIKLWLLSKDGINLVERTSVPTAVTAVSSMTTPLGKCILAIGMEDAGIAVYEVDVTSSAPVREIGEVSKSDVPAGRVNSLELSSKYSNNSLMLAAACDDSSVRLYRIHC